MKSPTVLRIAFCLLILLCTSNEILSQSTTRLVQQNSKVLTESHGLQTVVSIEKIGVQYVIIDRRNLIYTDLLFNKQKGFDFEGCHPGAPFNPSNIIRVGSHKLLIASTPVLSYFVDTETGECSTSQGSMVRLIPDYMASTESGFINYLRRGPNNLELASYSHDLTPIYQISFKDEYSFNEMRFRQRFRNSVLKISDDILMLNGPDFSVMRVKESDVTNKSYSLDVIQIPIPNMRKPDASIGGSGFSIADAYNVLREKHYVNGMYKGKGQQLLFEVRDFSKKTVSLYSCMYLASGLSGCSLVHDFPKGEEIRYAAQDEVITVQWKELPNGEYETKLVKYTIH